jgi:outer membrane protein TolC
MSAKNLFIVGCLVCLSGCAATPYSPPVTACATSDAVPLDPWWRAFGDTRLEALLNEARSCNVDLARRVLALSKDRLLLDKSDVSFEASLSGKSAKPLSGGETERRVRVNTSVSYELDLWGRVAREHDANAWRVRASTFDLRAVALSVEAEVATRYWTVVAVSRQRVLAGQNLETRRALLALTNSAIQTGALAPREGWVRQRDVLSAEQTVSRLEREEERARNALAALLDRSSSRGIEVAPRLSDRLPAIRPELSVEILSRRPDMAALQARLRERLALVDRARASFMPALTLTGELGASSLALGTLLSQPVASLGANLVLPFFNWRNLDIRLQEEKIAYQDLELDYRRTLHQALRESDDALSWRQRLLAEAGSLEKELALARSGEQEAELRFQLGDGERMAWYEAQLTVRDLEAQLLSNRFEQMSNLATIYKVFGGAPA